MWLTSHLRGGREGEIKILLAQFLRLTCEIVFQHDLNNGPRTLKWILGPTLPYESLNLNLLFHEVICWFLFFVLLLLLFKSKFKLVTL